MSKTTRDELQAIKERIVLLAEADILLGENVANVAKKYGFKGVAQMAASLAVSGHTKALTDIERDALCANLRRIIEGKNISIGHIASRIGMTYSAVRHWINGRSSPLPCLIPTLAKLLGITKDELLTPPEPEIEIVATNGRKLDGTATAIVVKPTSVKACNPNDSTMDSEFISRRANFWYVFRGGRFYMSIDGMKGYTPNELAAFADELYEVAEKMA